LLNRLARARLDVVGLREGLVNRAAREDFDAIGDGVIVVVKVLGGSSSEEREQEQASAAQGETEEGFHLVRPQWQQVHFNYWVGGT
jgi:hypothetical protein